MSKRVPFSSDQLRAVGSPKTYKGRQLEHLAFPIGGLGTGCISLNGWGGLVDFEIFNRPGKGVLSPHAFFTLYAEGPNGGSAKVLQGPLMKPDLTSGGGGPERQMGYGLPRFRNCEFEGAFPFGTLKLSDPTFPVAVDLEAFNPFVPLDADASGLPCALFTAKIHNPGASSVKVKLFANLGNIAGHPQPGRGRIEAFRHEGAAGIKLTTLAHPTDHPRYSEMALVSPWPNVEIQTAWVQEDGWWNAMQRFWNHASVGELETKEDAAESDSPDTGSIALTAEVAAGATVEIPVWIFWYAPVFEHYWHTDPKPVWRNYYATKFDSVTAVADHVALHYEGLLASTKEFAAAIFGSTLPASVMDAVSSQISLLKSTTCLRLEDGTFYGWEGCWSDTGCCEGSCTHVWNYAQAMPFLFPDVERTIRESDYRINLHPNGHMTFRMPLPLGVIPGQSFHAAGDGQLGGILKVYREWLLSGDTQWLKKLWPKVKLALEYAWDAWDPDKDGILEKPQHNTYDIEFFGPNTLVGSYYLAALRAAEEMAKVVGDEPAAKAYRTVFESGSKLTDEKHFKGEFYVGEVIVDGIDPNEVPWDGVGLNPAHPKYPRYQYGIGCLSDQLIGQWYARLLGLGDLYKPENVKSSLAAIFRHNWRDDLFDHANVQRIYAVNDDAGLLLCSWPNGGRPALPFPYSDEVWPGIEYQVAAHMIYEGLVDEGLAVVKGLRDRFDGTRRNPWNEFECGSHYARSMASFSLLLALSGYTFNVAEGHVGFGPKLEGDFSVFFSAGTAWGTYERKGTTAKIKVRAGSLRLASFGHGLNGAPKRATMDATDVAATFENGMCRLEQAVVLNAGSTLVVSI